MAGKIKKIFVIVIISCLGILGMYCLSGYILLSMPNSVNSISQYKTRVLKGWIGSCCHEEHQLREELAEQAPILPGNPNRIYEISFNSATSGKGLLIFIDKISITDIKAIDIESGENSYVYEWKNDVMKAILVYGSEHVQFDIFFEFTASYNKPVIYLYPEEETEVNVELDFHGDLTCTYPAYNDGWKVIASPDGTLTNLSDGRNYDYLFWEGNASAEYPMDNAVCVKGEDTCEFLEEYLTAAGLNDSEIDDFITYWLPEMQDNPYNLIAFQGELYEQVAELHVTPEPDSVLRIFMTFEALDEPVECGEFSMPEPFERSGFTVVEWGGTNLSE